MSEDIVMQLIHDMDKRLAGIPDAEGVVVENLEIIVKEMKAINSTLSALSNQITKVAEAFKQHGHEVKVDIPEQKAPVINIPEPTVRERKKMSFNIRRDVNGRISNVTAEEE